MTLANIFATRSRSGTQIVVDIETYCTLAASRTEIRRLIDAVAQLDNKTAPYEMIRIWAEEDHWRDPR